MKVSIEQPPTITIPKQSRLADGRLLLFDNLGVPELSRVLELDPFTRQVVWQYGGVPGEAFHSEGMGSVQRLPNGNTLVTDSFAGRAFEVTRGKQVVWRFDNPARGGARFRGPRGTARRRSERGELVAVVPELVRVDAAAAASWLPQPRRE